MIDRDWAECAVALEAFPGDFPPRQANAYRYLLVGLTRTEVMEAIRAHTRKGERWRPSPGEIVALAGRAATLPPFGLVRKVLTYACESSAVKLARVNVEDAIVGQIQEPISQAFVHAIGGERIRDLVLYTDRASNREWETLRRDYEGMGKLLTDTAFAKLQASPDRAELGP